MKIRAKSEIKLTDGNVNLTYTFVAGTELDDVITTLTELSKAVAEHKPDKIVKGTK